MTKIVRKVVAFILAALVLTAIAFTVTETEQKELSEHLKKLDNELSPYRVKQNDLESRINDLENQYDSLTKGKGNIIFLYKNINNRFSTSIIKKMSNYGVKGTMLLSKSSFPGNEGCISVDEFNKLINDGWKYCLAWEEGDTPESWKAYWENQLANIGLQLPKTVYFAKNVYSEEYDTFLVENGFDVIIHQGVKGSYYIVEGCEEEPWDICAVAWNDLNAKSLMQQSVSYGGTLVFSVGTSGDEQYDDVTFDAMLDTVYDYFNNGKIFITDVLSAKDYEIQISIERQEEKEAISKQIEELQAEWDALDEEMDKIYDSYKE